jgi:putative oxidoreductase
MSWLNLALLPLLARICLIVLFPFSALDKIIHWKDALKQANSSFIPGGGVLVIVAILIELLTPACIIIGWHDRIAAFVLAGFCTVTAVLYHPFWKFGDFWIPGDSKGRSDFWDFLKNFGLVGGLLLLLITTDFASVMTIIENPLSSVPREASPASVGSKYVPDDPIDHSIAGQARKTP